MSAVKWEDSPTPDRPVDVEFTLEVKGIQNIDARSGMTSVYLGMCLFWTDRRVAKACERDPLWKPPPDLWAPGVQLSNGMLEESQLAFSNKPGHRVEFLDRASGSLFLYLQFTGEVDNPMDLVDFPFDEDSLDFLFTGQRMLGGRKTATEFNLIPKDGDSFVSFFFDHQLPEFELLGVSYLAYRKWGASCITAGISLRRKAGYYFFKVTILMWLIVLLSMPVFLFEFDELEQRMNVVATMFLATAATLYVVGGDLPKTEGLNKMDKLLLGTLAVIFAAGAESIAVKVMHNEGELDAAEELESDMVAALPVLYAILNIILFGFPVLKSYFGQRAPRHMEADFARKFIPWDKVQKIDPWQTGVPTSASDSQDEAKEESGGALSEAQKTTDLI